MKMGREGKREEGEEREKESGGEREITIKREI